MELRFFHIIGIIAIFQSSFLAMILFNTRRGNTASNRILAALLMTFALLIGYSFTHSIGIGGYFIHYHKYIFIMGQLGFLIGPLLYFYIKSLLDRDFRLKKRNAIHGIPFIAATIYFTIRLLSIPHYNPWQSSLKLLYGAGILIQESVYVVLPLLLLRRYHIPLKNLFAHEADHAAIWLRIIICGFILIWNIKLQSFVLLDVYQRWGFCPYAESLYFLVMFMFFNAIAYVALKNPNILHNFIKYRTSELSKADIDKYRDQLTRLMETSKPYLEPSLTLPALAKKLSIPKGYLSQIVNESFNTNFCDFINGYRIEESKELLLDSSNGNKRILEIAYQVGFNSKSAFNRAFKKHTGVTPKELKKSSS